LITLINVQYQLKATLTGVLLDEGKRVVTTLPKGPLLTAVDGHPSIPGMIDVRANLKMYSVFEEDLKIKAQQVAATGGA
jgi:hypothetical protein